MAKKERKESNVKVLGTANTFKYNVRTDAIIDGNSVQQLIFVKDYKGERKTMMEYTWHSKDLDGNVVKRGIKVSGHGTHGVPTLADYSVYCALQRLFIQQKTVNGVCELKYDNYDDEYLTINFTITALAKEMGYASTPSQVTRNKLKKSIEVLLATTLFSMHEGGLYDIRKKKYVKANLTNGFHLLESIDTIEDEESMYTRVRLSEYTYNQIVNDFKLFYNRNKFNTIKNDIAKKIYHLALQWRGDKNFSFANIDTLTERIPSVQEEKKYNKRDIKKAIKYLQDKNIVGIKYDENNSDKVYFVFEGNEISDDLKNKYKTYKEIKERLFEMGFDIVEVDELLDLERIRYIQALLRYMDTRNPKNPKKYFKTGLTNPYNIPTHFYDEVI